jgi:DNA-directed RNA polymerase subunit alpha
MEPITDCGINLFADTLPSMDELNKLSDFVHSSEINLMNFNQEVEENISRTSAKAVLAVGIGFYILGKNADSVEKLKKGNDCKEKFFYLALALRRMGKFNEAIESLKKSLDHGADALSIRLETAATYREARNVEAAAKELKKCANFENVSTDYHYQLGYLQESEGLYDQAMENYEKAIELFPNHQKAMFRLAFRYDMAGDEEAAIDYYKQPPLFI